MRSTFKLLFYINRNKVKSVSYTHLDVYKRQLQNSTTRADCII